MKNYYFTFGQAHIQKSGSHKDAGLAMKNYWIRVEAENFGTARAIFIRDFSSKYMKAPDKWAFQYEESHFEPKWFPYGEYKCLKQKV